MTNQKPTLPNPFPAFQGLVVPPQHNQAQVVKSKKKNKAPKAGTNGTLISFILDESGSMTSCYDATVIGFNEYVKGQKSTEGKCQMTLTKFEGGHVRKLYENIDINEVQELGRHNYQPAGGTNLLDAIGETIESIDVILDNTKKKQRPSVLVVIMTDGEENQSRKFNNETIKEMISSREASDWGFVFLGANIDAFSVSSSLGLSASSTMAYSTTNMAATMSAVSDSTTRYRHARSMGMSSAEIAETGYFTDAERKSVI
jgi:hypothetical protein